VTTEVEALPTVTVVLLLVLPPEPVHVKVYVVLAVGETDCELESAFVPVNVPPEAVHDVAPVDDHVSVELCPAFIEVGDAVSVTIGAGVDNALAGVLRPDEYLYDIALSTGAHVTNTFAPSPLCDITDSCGVFGLAGKDFF